MNKIICLYFIWYILIRVLILVLLFAVGIFTEPVSKACTFRGKTLSGKVKIVEYGEDFKVKYVEYGPRLP